MFITCTYILLCKHLCLAWCWVLVSSSHKANNSSFLELQSERQGSVPPRSSYTTFQQPLNFMQTLLLAPDIVFYSSTICCYCSVTLFFYRLKVCLLLLIYFFKYILDIFFSVGRELTLFCYGFHPSKWVKKSCMSLCYLFSPHTHPLKKKKQRLSRSLIHFPSFFPASVSKWYVQL